MKFGSLYQKMGRYVSAESLFTDALGRAERTIRQENLTVASLIDNLASLELDRGNFKKAESLYVSVLEAIHPHFRKPMKRHNVRGHFTILSKTVG